MIGVLISENKPGAADKIAEKLSGSDDIQVVGYARDGLEAAQMTTQLRPDVALIHTSLAGVDGFQACQMASLATPETACILLTAAGDDPQDTWRKAMRAGARDLLPEETSAEQLLAAIHEVATLKEYKERPEYQIVTDPTKMPVTIAVTGAKGGIGKTTIATNLAVCLQQQFPEQVVVVDFVGQYGDVSLLLDMPPRGGWSELVNYEELDADLVETQLSRHSTGLKVLAAPTAPDIKHLQKTITVEYVADLLSILRSKYRFVVLDIPPLIGDISAYVFSRCTHIAVVTYLLDLAAIRDTGALMESLVDTRMPAERVKLVVNRYSQRNPFTIADLQQTVKHRIDSQIPADTATVTAALNEGIPVVLKSPGSAVAKAIRSLANTIVAELPTQQGGRTA